MDEVQIISFKQQNVTADKKSAIDLFIVKCFPPIGCANFHIVFKRWENDSLEKSSPLTSVYLRLVEADMSPVINMGDCKVTYALKIHFCELWV